MKDIYNDIQNNCRKKKLETLGLLAGGIAHDFNNILAGITGYIDLAMTELPEGSGAYTYLQEAVNICSLAGDMVKEIFLSTVEAEEVTPLHIIPVIKESLNLLRMSLFPSIKLMEYIDVTSDTVMANRTQIYHILSNLCANAIQAIGDKEGIIEVSLTDMKENELYPDLKGRNYLNLTVKDNGCGINSEHVEQIFDPFFTTKKYKKGKGIGLALVNNIIVKLNGKIYVRSKEGEYSIFQVFLPCLSSDTGYKREDFKSNYEAKGTILSIDHNVTIY